MYIWTWTQHFYPIGSGRCVRAEGADHGPGVPLGPCWKFHISTWQPASQQTRSRLRSAGGGRGGGKGVRGKVGIFVHGFPARFFQIFPFSIFFPQGSARLPLPNRDLSLRMARQKWSGQIVKHPVSKQNDEQMLLLLYTCSEDQSLFFVKLFCKFCKKIGSGKRGAQVFQSCRLLSFLLICFRDLVICTHDLRSFSVAPVG